METVLNAVEIEENKKMFIEKYDLNTLAKRKTQEENFEVFKINIVLQDKVAFWFLIQ